MSVEQHATRHLEVPPIIRNAVRSSLRPISASGTRMVEYSGLENLEKLKGFVDKNTLLVIATRHCSHSDILVTIRIVDEIQSIFPQRRNYYIPIAASLYRGVQGLHAQLLYSEGAVPLLDQRQIKPLAVVTENDRIKRQLKPNYGETKLLLNAAEEDQSTIFAFPEGSVEGGRRDLLGNPKGMQEVRNRLLSTIFQKAHEAGKKVVILSVGISGTTSMLSAESVFFTWDTIGALFQDWIFRNPLILASANIGSPYEYPNNPAIDLTKNPHIVNESVMKSIALLVPPKERGYYYPPSRAYQEAMRDFESQLEKDERRLIEYGLAYRDELRQLTIQYSQIR